MKKCLSCGGKIKPAELIFDDGTGGEVELCEDCLRLKYEED